MSTYVYKQNKLYGKIEEGRFFIYKDNEYALDDIGLAEITDILPEGIDLQIMLRSFNKQNPIELLPYLKNTIGDFSFSRLEKNKSNDNVILSNIEITDKFPNVLHCDIDISTSFLVSPQYLDLSIGKKQMLSLSGYQHKLQVSIVNNTITDNYGDFILKPCSDKYYDLPINEHLNVSFMREFGFEVPFNALVYDERQKEYHYLIKRFDIDENGDKLPQISLNSLMKSKDKYDGTIERISTFLKDKLVCIQKMQFLKYIYANALLYNNDLHKKNISFVFKDNKLILSPAYDVLNVYAVKPTSKMDILGKEQCYLTIKGSKNGITISHFEQASKNIGLDFGKVQASLNDIQNIYIKKYPQYIKNITKIPNIRLIAEFTQKLQESYDKNLKKIAHSKTTYTDKLKAQIPNLNTEQKQSAKQFLNELRQSRNADNKKDTAQRQSKSRSKQ